MKRLDLSIVLMRKRYIWNLPPETWREASFCWNDGETDDKVLRPCDCYKYDWHLS